MKANPRASRRLRPCACRRPGPSSRSRPPQPCRSPTALSATSRPDGRLIVFFINDPFIGFQNTGYLRDLLHRFVDGHMSDNDQVAIWPIMKQMPRQEFTSDRDRLDAVINRLEGGAGRVPIPAEQTLISLDGVLSGMKHISSRRKVVILVGGETLGPAFLGTQLFEDALRLAAAANVSVYPISLTGVAAPPSITGAASANAGALPLALNVLAQETGGVVADRNNIDAALARVEEDAGT